MTFHHNFRHVRLTAALGVAALVTIMVTGCNQAKFAGDENTSKGKAPKSAAGSANPSPSNGGDSTKDPNAYGTPPTDNITKPGWAQDQGIKDLVDALFAQGGNPTLGSAPKTGQNSGDQTPGGAGGDQDGSKPGVGSSGNGDDSYSKGGLFDDASGVLWLPCDATNNGIFKSEFFGKKGVKVRVAGEFCPEARLVGDVTVLFVVDHSGSMEGSLTDGANDKTTGGSCGRLRSAQVIVDRYKSMKDAKVSVGVVNFSTGARTDVAVGPLNGVPLTGDVFCGADLGGLTNYQAAFSEAARALAGISGKKLVYFISDGAPTLGGLDPRAAGLQAAQTLRQLPDLSLFALFVGYNGLLANNPQGYLEQITGDPKAVRVTANAQELVQAAATLGQLPVGINKGDVVAEVTNANGTKAVSIERFLPRANTQNRYLWVTEPVELTGVAGKSELNSVKVEATTSFGFTLDATAEISYKMTSP